MISQQPVRANAHRVSDVLFVGGAPGTGPAGDAAAEVAELAGLGVTDVLDCRSEALPSARDVVVAAGLGYASAPMADGLEAPEPGWFDTGLAHARAVLADPDRVLFTHCQGGRGRGPSMGFAVLLDIGTPPAQAYAQIKQVRPKSLISYAPQALDEHIARNSIDSDQAQTLRRELAEETARWA
jgi:hypothetical protein